jgi:hypothetical protein
VFARLVVFGAVLIGAGAPHYAQEPILASTSADVPVGRWVDRTPLDEPASARPGGSEDSSAIYDPVRGRMVVYGGKDDADLSSKETWAFDPAERAWERIETQGRTPPASEDHTAIYDPVGHRLILHGGENGPTTNKLWSLDLETSTWRELTDSDAPRRESHSAVYDARGKRMIVFGGFDRGDLDLYDVWAMDLDPASPTFEKWQNLTVAEGRPFGRIDHAAAYDPGKNRLIFYGGWTKARQGLFGDTWAFYLPESPESQGRWMKIETAPAAPPARRHGVAVHDSDRNLFVLFGGQGQTGYLNDVWALDLTRDVWMEVTPTEPGPMARIDHQAVYDSRAGSLLLYGGDGGLDDLKLHDVWELTLAPATSSSPVATHIPDTSTR